jgi:hypothetical protein
VVVFGATGEDIEKLLPNRRQVLGVGAGFPVAFLPIIGVRRCSIRCYPVRRPRTGSLSRCKRFSSGGMMKSTIDDKLDLMVRSLQEHIELARELKLDFVVQLLTMTAIEIKLKLHGISEQEINTICSRPEHKSPLKQRESALVINFPGRNHHS